MELSSIASQGLERAQANFERSAGRMASIAAPPEGEMPVDVADLSTAAADLLQARQDFTLNLKLAATANDMERETLNLLA